jgi:hypothetical protein
MGRTDASTPTISSISPTELVPTKATSPLLHMPMPIAIAMPDLSRAHSAPSSSSSLAGHPGGAVGAGGDPVRAYADLVAALVILTI